METLTERILNVGKRAVKPFNTEDYGIREDEYAKGEMIYCRNCNGERLFVDKDHGIRARCLCDCQSEKLRKSKKEAEELKKQMEIERLQRASLIGERYKNASFSSTDTGNNETFDTAYLRCKKYCEVANEVLAKGMGIYLYGASGTGKTHLTACMANELIKQRKQVLFTNFGEIAKVIKSTFNSKENDANYIYKLATIDFLFIDDLGAERVVNKDGDMWLQEMVFDILNKRYINRKPTIFTSNYSLAELMNGRGFSQRTVDRIAEMASAVMKLEGKSYRLANRVKDLPF